MMDLPTSIDIIFHDEGTVEVFDRFGGNRALVASIIEEMQSLGVTVVGEYMSAPCG